MSSTCTSPSDDLICDPAQQRRYITLVLTGEVRARSFAVCIDVAENTKGDHRAAVAAIVPLIATRCVDSIDAADVAEVVANLVSHVGERP